MSLLGSFQPPGDKSISHRAALFPILAGGRALVENLSPCQDVASSLAAAAVLGVDISSDTAGVAVTGSKGLVVDSARLDCGNSGTTIRLLMGILAGRPGQYELTGDESLRRRPMERVAAPLRSMGAEVETTDGRAPLTIRGGRLQGIEYELPVASAQLKSAVLLAGAQASGETRVIEPVPSRDHTERMLAQFGGRISIRQRIIRVNSSPLTLPPRFRVPGDPSSAAFFLCAAAILPGSDLTAEGMLLNPTRIGFLDVLRRMGAPVHIEETGRDPEPWGRVRVRYAPDLKGVRIAPGDIPLLVDEVPILALVAAAANGTTVFEDAGELRVKESDRLAAVRDQLGLMGADVSIVGDDLVVRGPAPLKVPERLDSYGDHRMAMTLRLALRLAGGDCPIDREESARVSYPGFHDELGSLWQ